MSAHDHDHDYDHDHDRDDDADDDRNPPDRDHGHGHDAPPSPYHRSERTAAHNAALAERVAKLESLLVAKGLVATDALDKLVEIYEHDLGPMNGAKVVAHAWVDPAYKRRLLDDATSAIAELGFGGLQGEHMVVVENTPQTHNVVVCTLCSCYPWPVLGLPPAWYKDAAYRSRIVIDPRGVLREFGTELADDVEVRVWDSSAEVRYLVLPQRPAGADHLGEAELAELVDRDAMIGVTKVASP
jgi:nitrile hydratase